MKISWGNLLEGIFSPPSSSAGEILVFGLQTISLSSTDGLTLKLAAVFFNIQTSQKFMKDACMIKFILILIKYFQSINAVFVKISAYSVSF